MKNTMQFVLWGSVAWLVYVYVGYPLVLFVISRFRPFRSQSSGEYLPSVSVLLAARNEQADIRWKIAETLAWDYPSDKIELLVASDASEDSTDEIVKSVPDARLRYLRIEPRKGKAQALNCLSELARGELLFFSDVNSHIGPECLRQIARHFADPRVGCVTGSERTSLSERESPTVTGMRACLGYESIVSAAESRIGSVLVCDGSIFCIRRKLFTRLQPELANDLELPIRIAATGHRILFEPLAVAFENAATVPQEEFQRRRRIVAQGVLGYWRLRPCLKGMRAWQFLSHKVLRWLGAVPMALLFVSNCVLVSNQFYKLILGVQIGFYLLAFLGWRAARMKKDKASIVTFPFYFLTVNFGALFGVWDALAGKRFSVWESSMSSRGFSAASKTEGQA